ncbi:MAG TPA: thioesterase family protein [Acidimicrobiia bacterium]|nr:thioesterase family protein [Acidimicrobiia bacterium]
MESIPPAPYLPTHRPDVFESTPLARAGWYEDGQHGGAVAALLGRAMDRVPTLAPMEMARLTVELFRVVPVTRLHVATRVIREGKRIQAVEASLTDSDDLELARATGLKLRRTEVTLPDEVGPTPAPRPLPTEIPAPDMKKWGVGAPGRILYHRQAVEVREIDGGFFKPGPGAMWLRMTRPLVEGEPISPLERAIAVGDFVNGLSRLSNSLQMAFMNADLTIHLSRYPVGEWVGVRARSEWESIGRGVAGGDLFDPEGVIGRSTQTLFIDRRS